MIYTLTLNPSIDQHITVSQLIKDDKIKAKEIWRDPGGKGINVSRVVQELGAQTKAYGLVGGYAGHMLKDLLKQRGIPYSFFETPSETRINFILTDLSDQSQTRISAPGSKLSVDYTTHLIKKIEHIASKPSYWVLGGSLPPGVPQDVYKKLITFFNSKGRKCILDADDQSLKLGIQARPFLVKPNEYELQRLVGKTCKTDKDFLDAGRKISNKVEVVAISLASRGAIIVSKEKAWRIQIPKVKVQSKVGAGDSFVGGLVTALDQGLDFETALRWAAAAGTAAVMRQGTKLCDRADVKRLLNAITIKNLS